METCNFEVSQTITTKNNIARAEPKFSLGWPPCKIKSFLGGHMPHVKNHKTPIRNGVFNSIEFQGFWKIPIPSSTITSFLHYGSST